MPNLRTKKLRIKLKKAAKVKQSVMKQAYEYFKKITPRRTGNAQRQTKLVNDEIVADYSYAPILDKGRHLTPRGARGSTQAPDGMSKPTMKLFRDWIKKYIRIGN